MEAFEQSAGRIAQAMGAAARSVAPSAPIMLGQIIQAEPLRLQANGLTIEQDSILVNEGMKKGYSPKLIAPDPLPGTCPDGATSTPVTEDQLVRGTFALEKGDQVVVMSPDGQTYYILCKVVGL